MRKLVVFETNENITRIKIVEKGRTTNRFYFIRNNLIKLISGSEGSAEIYEKDLNNLARVFFEKSSKKVTFTFYWIPSINSDNHFEGYVQEASVSLDVLEKAVGHEGRTVALDQERVVRPRIELTRSGMEQVKKMSKTSKRAFSKFMRDAFYWKNSTCIRIGSDWDGFFFAEETIYGHGISGGIIPHTLSRKTRSGISYPCTKYEIHT